MRKVMTALVACASLGAGCKLQTLPDPLEAHPLAHPEKVHILVRRADGSYSKVRVEYPTGSLIATPEAIRAADR